MTRNGIFFILALACSITYAASLLSNVTWRWKCNTLKEACTRISNDSVKSRVTLYSSLENCRLVCGKYGALWPQPTGDTKIGSTLFEFSISSLQFILPSDNDISLYLQKATTIFKKSVTNGSTLNCLNLYNKVTVSFQVASSDTTLNWATDESYHLSIQTSAQENTVKIRSQTVFGARHALETLSQLIEVFSKTNVEKCYVLVEEAEITDAPAYPHRGLLLDTARNFQSVDIIKTHINGMGTSKLNVLHWHVTDTQSFPLEIPSLPNMTKYGAYSNDKIYRPEDVADLMKYAKVRGVRIVLEFDAPSHAGNGWQWGPEAGLGNLAVCVNQQPWRSYCIQPPCGQLNPVNSNLYLILKKLYSDMMDMVPKGEIFHMGGDEVFIPCWNSTPEIIAALGNKPRSTETFLDLWADYQAQVLAVFDEVVGNNNTPILLWTSDLTNVGVVEKYLSKKRYVIQTWVPAADSLPYMLLYLGYKIIVSTKDAWYLDHGFWGSTVYHNWMVAYDNPVPNHPNSLGGEACMWGEYVDDSSVQSKVWPRAAAVAERLWTNPNTTSSQAARRFYRHRERLVSRNISAEAVVPRWCYQNEGEC